MPDENYDVIVIGSGPGGSSTATLLQKRGYKVLILEKNNFIGMLEANRNLRGDGLLHAFSTAVEHGCQYIGWRHG
jgi:flavin-dependent dehydrogenase